MKTTIINAEKVADLANGVISHLNDRIDGVISPKPSINDLGVKSFNLIKDIKEGTNSCLDVTGIGRSFLHRHPEEEKRAGIDNDHVIVDRSDWEMVLKFLMA